MPPADNIIKAEPQAAADAQEASEDKLGHLSHLALHKGRDEFAFDEEWYLSQYPDVVIGLRRFPNLSAFDHYLEHGRKEGRMPVPPSVAIGTVSGAPSDGAIEARQSGPGERQTVLDPSLAAAFVEHNGEFYLTPHELFVSGMPLQRVAIIGSCMTEQWGIHRGNTSNCPIDFITVNNLSSLPAQPAERIREYDFQVLQLPLRGVLPDASLWHLGYDDVIGHERVFQEACERVEVQLRGWMEWNVRYGLLTFVSNFLLPQQNLMGRLFPRFDIRNPEYFVEKLNEHLEKLVRMHKNAYILDVDRISASLGRRYMQDDSVAQTSHGALMGMPGIITNRLEPLAPMGSHYKITWSPDFQQALWNELVSMYRTVRQVDSVKLVVVDLDDTLWSGISGDMDEIGPSMVEGWHLGLVESLLYLKKRGVLLGIISRNEEERIRSIWQQIFGNRLRLEDFAAIRINWRPKAESMREVLDIMNLLPRSVVFIDDNPVERVAMRGAFPDMRVLGRHPYDLRRALLWAAETQVVSVSDESARRTEMIQAQFERETQRQVLSQDDFLRAAEPQVTMIEISSAEHPRFARALELINKTNQFNTTGKRWKAEDCEAAFGTDHRFCAFEAADKYTNYGLVGVVIVGGASIEQWVMSCRVLGYQLEEAVMATLVRIMWDRGATHITGTLVHTDVNFPCRDLFAKCGFRSTGDDWVLDPDAVIVAPAHVNLSCSAIAPRQFGATVSLEQQ